MVTLPETLLNISPVTRMGRGPRAWVASPIIIIFPSHPRPLFTTDSTDAFFSLSLVLFFVVFFSVCVCVCVCVWERGRLGSSSSELLTEEFHCRFSEVTVAVIGDKDDTATEVVVFGSGTAVITGGTVAAVVMSVAVVVYNAADAGNGRGRGWALFIPFEIVHLERGILRVGGVNSSLIFRGLKEDGVKQEDPEEGRWSYLVQRLFKRYEVFKFFSSRTSTVAFCCCCFCSVRWWGLWTVSFCPENFLFGLVGFMAY